MSSDSVPHDGDRTSDLTRQRTPGQLARYTPSSWHTVPPVHEYVYSGEQNIHLSPLHRFMRIPESGICTARWRPTMAVPVSSTTVRYNRTPPLVLNLPEESAICHGQATECAIATLSQPLVTVYAIAQPNLLGSSDLTEHPPLVQRTNHKISVTCLLRSPV